MIYICIPTHNEQQTVGVVLWKLRQVLTEFHRDYQLLVADDASTDKTTDVLEPYTRVLPLTVIRSESRQGYAASLEMLLREAVRRSEYPKRDVIVTLQADFSEEPDDIVGLIKRMEAGADVAAGIKVGAVKDSRVRRLARSLSGFFARRQTWPEGVVTPFDGYRAYRLYAVKRAIEERNGRRLLHYDGWAGHAELLRAVLPHARRVDTLNVEDRPDRLQRPRREKPLAAVWQVRAMAMGAEPEALTSVEELDRIAATASRSRDRNALSAAVRPVARPNGRDRRRPDSREGRESRGEARRPDRGGRPERPERPERTERPERPGRTERGERRDRGERTGSAERGGQPREVRGERPERTRGEGQDRRPRTPRQEQARPKRPEPQAGEVPVEELLEGVGADASDAGGAGETGEVSAPKKRRRRRRGRGGSAAGAGEAQAGAEAPNTEARQAALSELDALLEGLSDRIPGPAEAGEGGQAEAGDEEGDGAGSERKRRRRGGRRGGRGRRRTPRAEGEAGPDEAGVGGGDGESGGGDGGGAEHVGEADPVQQERGGDGAGAG